MRIELSLWMRNVVIYKYSHRISVIKYCSRHLLRNELWLICFSNSITEIKELLMLFKIKCIRFAILFPSTKLYIHHKHVDYVLYDECFLLKIYETNWNLSFCQSVNSSHLQLSLLFFGYHDTFLIEELHFRTYLHIQLLFGVI